MSAKPPRAGRGMHIELTACARQITNADPVNDAKAAKAAASIEPVPLR
jgi:hypothetical protein